MILDEPDRIGRVQRNAEQFIGGLKSAGFDTMQSETAIVPVLCGTDEDAYKMARLCQREDIFVLPVVSPAVPEGMARLRATVTAGHNSRQIERALSVLEKAGKQLGLI